jgi:hypothetical protein
LPAVEYLPLSGDAKLCLSERRLTDTTLRRLLLYLGEVLAMKQWDKVELMRLLKTQVDVVIKTDRFKPNNAMKLLSDYERLLQEYTYLSLNVANPSPQPGNWLSLN